MIEYKGAVIEGRARDISLGGMFLEAPTSVPFDAEVIVAVTVPALPDPVRITCRVRWVTSEGMGVSFGALRAVETWAINQLVAQSAPAD